MTRRSTIALLTSLVAVLGAANPAAEELPVGSAPEPVPVPHFPDRVHAVVWRNWDVVATDRIAAVLGTSVANVRAIATSMGLPAADPFPEAYRSRGYITALRRNWHLLPYDQLLVLLDMSQEELAYNLREDDFLFVKLGRLKPQCKALRYSPPGAAAKRRAAEIRRVVERHFGAAIRDKAQPRFGFVAELSRPTKRIARERVAGERIFALRFIYSYFASYGDPLADARLDPYPPGLLDRLANVGVDGVWLHVVLRRLAPGGDGFPEFGDGWEARLENLRRLVDRAKQRGIGIYLYLNEPRAMPPSFFAARPDMAGVREGESIAMCTSHPAVRRWLTSATAHVFREVPGLAGAFTITASENLTNCASHGRWKQCPRCRQRSDADIIAEVNAAIEAGVHAGNADAKMIAWDWGWRGHGDAPETIAKLPARTWLMSVSEWGLPIARGGVRAVVDEYSISAVGPGPRAQRHWKLAKERGLRTVAKVQLNSTWEMSAVPYLPVMNLVAQHCRNLAVAGVDGMMLTWTLGGYPSPNLQIAERFSRRPTPTVDEALDEVARARFGVEGAPHARRAWRAFSDAFREFPMGGSGLYTCPTQYGPANPLYAEKTGYRASMIGFPYDDVRRWRGPYPADVYVRQFEKIATGWRGGLGELEAAVQAAPKLRRADALAELRYARTAWLHFRTVANQTRFVLARDALRAGAADKKDEIRRLVAEEIATARELYRLAKEDSRIGFEATNRYYYVPLDLVEKVVNCEWVVERLVGERGGESPR